MNRNIIFIFSIVMFVLAGCNPATPEATPAFTEIPVALTQTPSSEPTIDVKEQGFSDEWLSSLDPQTILIQLDYEPTLSIPEEFYEFGRIPPFTLYANGTVFYTDENLPLEEQGVFYGNLTPEQTLYLIHQVMDDGFTKLESYLDSCKDLGDGTQVCAEDGPIQIIRVIQEDGTLREVNIYAGFANEPQVFIQIVDFLTNYTYPNAQFYKPEGATLFVQPLTDAIGVSVLEWPFDPTIINSLRSAFVEGGMTAIPLTGELLTQFLSAVPRNAGYYFFTLDGQDYSTKLVPWLPGVDFIDDIQQEFPTPPVEFSNPDNAPTMFANCPMVNIPQADTFFLAYTSAGDLWLWDWGEEPVQVTFSGDVTQGVLTDDGRQAFFVREYDDFSELWVVDRGGGEPRLLTQTELQGTLQILSTSFDQQWIAFIHRLPEGSGELWVASLDGKDTRMIISQDELMSIINEPLADFAYPAGVTWIPNTYTLTYDAAPGFNEDGLYIYVQTQNWVVDAVTGKKGELFPAGEGGQISYSPDGTTMMILTPDSLKFMNVEAKDLHEANVDFFATGFGEYYAYPSLEWFPDSKAILLAQPVDDSGAINQDVVVNIWYVPVDGTPSTMLLEVSGFFADFSFSPGLDKVAYWRPVEPGSNKRELHLAALDGSEHIIYDTAKSLEFKGWAPDSQSFLYAIDNDSTHPLMLGNICQPPYLMTTTLASLEGWLDADSFLYLRLDIEPYELLLGTTNGAVSGVLTPLNGWFDYAVIGR